MGTRSAIGIKLEDGTVKAVYCHWDGYPEYNGKILLNHYDEKKTLKLLALGDLSSLGKVIGTKHSFNEASNTQCTFYGRDRGETGIEARVFADDEAYYNDMDGGIEYWYLLNGEDWYVRAAYEDEINDWKLVNEVLAKEEIENA